MCDIFIVVYKYFNKTKNMKAFKDFNEAENFIVIERLNGRPGVTEIETVDLIE